MGPFIGSIFSDAKTEELKTEDLKKQYSDLKETLQRVYAEFQNYKKRTDQENIRSYFK